KAGQNPSDIPLQNSRRSASPISGSGYPCEYRNSQRRSSHIFLECALGAAEARRAPRHSSRTGSLAGRRRSPLASSPFPRIGGSLFEACPILKLHCNPCPAVKRRNYTALGGLGIRGLGFPIPLTSLRYGFGSNRAARG